MMFEKRKQREKHEDKRSLGEKFHKFIFLAGVAIAFKGLKAWLRSKKKRMT